MKQLKCIDAGIVGLNSLRTPTSVCVCACVRVCVRACVRACVRVCVCAW